MSAADPHEHFRRRIDELTDQRDQAVEALMRARAGRKRALGRLYTMRDSRDLWRHRALHRKLSTRREPMLAATAALQDAGIAALNRTPFDPKEAR